MTLNLLYGEFLPQFSFNSPEFACGDHILQIGDFILSPKCFATIRRQHPYVTDCLVTTVSLNVEFLRYKG